MDTLGDALSKFFGVVARGQTYRNTLYLLMSFPLGVFYFVFLVTGLALGFSLIIIWVGLLILAVVFATWYGLLAFERQIAITLLNEDIPPMLLEDASHLTLCQKFVAAVRSPVTWKGLAYLFAKFPLGIVSFALVIALLAASAGLIVAPIYYPYIHPQINLAYAWVIDTPAEAAFACLLGVILATASMHVFNGLAWVSGRFARMMLGSSAGKHTFPTPAPLEEPSI